MTGKVTIPGKTDAGRHPFKLIAHDPDRTLSADITVRPPELPPTGADTGLALSGVAAGLAALGGGVVLVARRRNPN